MQKNSQQWRKQLAQAAPKANLSACWKTKKVMLKEVLQKNGIYTQARA